MNNHEWLLVDLHMHGAFSKPFDKKRVDESKSADAMVKELKDAGVDIFSVTDHCFFSESFYNQLETAAQSYGMRLLYGAELNVYVDPPKSDHFQMGVYFRPGISKRKFSKALIDLYKPTKNGQNTKQPRFGDIIEALFGMEEQFLIMPEADKASGLNKAWKYFSKNNRIEDCDNNLKHGISHFYNGYDAKDSFDKNGANQWALSFYKKTTKFIEDTKNMSEPEIEEAMGRISSSFKNNDVSKLNKTEMELADTIKEYGSSFCYFSFSDWHNNEPYSPTTDNYIFGSKDKPFESVWAATEDPFSRLRKVPHGNQKPEIPNNYIKEISFTSKGKPVSIAFQPELNAVIGKRASGKSMLMETLAYLHHGKPFDNKIATYAKEGLIDLNSIKCVSFDGVKINPGSLSSIEIIDQNTIKDIYENPSLADKSFAAYFPKLNDVSRSSFDSLINAVKALKPYPNTFPSVNVFLAASGSFKSLSFNNPVMPDLSAIETKENNLLSAFNELISSMNAAGLMTDSFIIARQNVQDLIDLSRKRFSLFRSFMEKVDSLIKKEIDAAAEGASKDANAREAHSESIKTIRNAFSTLSNLKKVEYSIDNFKIGIPDPKMQRSGAFLFKSAYSCKDDEFREAIRSTMAEQVKKAGVPYSNDFDLIKKYLLGQADLKLKATSLADGLEKTFWSDYITIDRVLYRIRDDYVGEEFDCSNIEDARNNNKVEDISHSSLGNKSSAYLEFLLSRNSSIILFDQPEDNIDNDYISRKLVPLLKKTKRSKQLIFVTHNPSIAVYGDAFNYIHATNDGNGIKYSNYYLEDFTNTEDILTILDGGRLSFFNRNEKYQNVIGGYKWAK